MCAVHLSANDDVRVGQLHGHPKLTRRQGESLQEITMFYFTSVTSGSRCQIIWILDSDSPFLTIVRKLLRLDFSVVHGVFKVIQPVQEEYVVFKMLNIYGISEYQMSCCLRGKPRTKKRTAEQKARLGINSVSQVT